jgi:hypothetical protein
MGWNAGSSGKYCGVYGAKQVSQSVGQVRRSVSRSVGVERTAIFLAHLQEFPLICGSATPCIAYRGAMLERVSITTCVHTA